MKDPQDFYAVVSNSVRDDIRGSADDALPRLGHAAGTPHTRKICKVANRFIDSLNQRCRGGRVVGQNVLDEGQKITPGLSRPRYLQRAFFRSPLMRWRASAMTSACGVNSPASAAATPFSTSATNQTS